MKCESEEDEIIPTYYSFKQATVEGWVFTNHINYSPDGETVAVCPYCAKK